MKITYIIGPFKSPRYLVRCINAILRQTAGDNEVIVADNSFAKSKEFEEFLSTVKGVKLISDKPETELDKINQAISLADDDSYINIISAGTVAVPIASETVSEFDADIITVSHALKKDDGYVVKTVNNNFHIDSSVADIQNFFFKKKLLADLTAERLCERIPFELWIDKLILENTNAVSNEICFYCGAERIKHKADDAECYLDNKDTILEIADKAIKIGSTAGEIIFDKHLSRLYKILISNKYELSVKADIYDIIKRFAEQAKANEFAKRIFDLYFCLDAESVCAMNAEEYLLYADRAMMLDDKPITKAYLEKMIEEAIAPIEKRIDKNQKNQLEKIKEYKDQAQFYKSEYKKVKNNPQEYVVDTFGQGKLGLRVLVKCFKAWLKHKFGGKKK